MQDKASDSIKITKAKRDYHSVLKKAIREQYFFIGLVGLFCCYWAYQIYPYRVIWTIFFIAFGIVYWYLSIYNAYQIARYQVIEIELWKDRFRIKYQDKNQIKELDVREGDQLSIHLNYQGRGFFPLNDKDRVTSILIKNVSQKKQIPLKPGNGWSSEELFNLYQNHFKKNEYYYRLQNINTQIED